MERGEIDGDGTGLSQSRYHILNAGSQRRAPAASGESALVTQPPAESSLALTPLWRPRGRPFPKTLLLSPSRLCAVQRKELLPPARLHFCFFSLLASDLRTYLKSLFLPCLTLNWKRTGESQHKTKGPGRNPKVEGRAVLEGCRCWI